MTARELLDLLIEQAPKLRGAGVTSVAIEGMSFHLLPGPPQTTAAGKRRAVEDELDENNEPDVLNDPATYGRSNGVPGFTPTFRQRREGEES